MNDILDEIIADTRLVVEAEKRRVTSEQLYERIQTNTAQKKRSMRKSLSQSPTGIIAEFKRKSPSKGWIKEEGRAEVIPASYEQAGAAAISILTNEKYFAGSLDFIRTARKNVDIPILRKEFVVDEYQLYQAKEADADAVLLIAAALTRNECRHLTVKAHDLGLEVLLEIHQEKELDYLDAEPDMLGVNNRNLGTFHTDVANSFRIARLLPDNILHVSESGISNPDTAKRLRDAGYRGFLIGETFMRQPEPGEALRKFIQEICA